MVKINLLPLEKRRPERTPLPRFLAILGAVAGTFSLLAYLVFMWMLLGDAQGKRREKQEDWDKPKTRDVETLNLQLVERKKVYEARKATLEKLRPPFRWTEVLDLMCDKLDATHKRIWFEEIKAFEPNDLRTKQQETGFAVEAGMIVDGSSAGTDPAPLLDYRQELVQRPKPGVEATPAKKPARVMVDYFTGGLSRNISFLLKEQADFEERFSQNFKTEFYIKQGATAQKPK